MSLKSIVNSLGALVAGLLMLVVATNAQASLIGDPEVTFTVDLTFDVPNVGTGFMLSDTETFGPIVNGPDHLFSIEDGGAIFVEIDIESESILLKVTNVTNFFNPTNITGQLSFTGLDWVGQDGFIVDFGGPTDFDDIPTADIIDNGHGIQFGFVESSLDFGEMIVTEINLAVVHVPEPGTLALFGLGLAGLGFKRRKRAA